MSEQDQSHMLCKQCCNDIPPGARLCSHCSSYQDWRSWFSVSSTVLAMLTALVSVLGIATPAVINVLHSPKSDAILQVPSLDGTTLRVVASPSRWATGFNLFTLCIPTSTSSGVSSRLPFQRWMRNEFAVMAAILEQ